MSTQARPWYLRAFVIISAWFTALFFLGWFGFFFSKAESILAILGLGLTAGSALLARAGDDNEFLEHACVAASLAGRAALWFGLKHWHLSSEASAGALLLFEPLWFRLNPGFVGRWVAAASGFLCLHFFLRPLSPGYAASVALLLTALVANWAFDPSEKRLAEAKASAGAPLGWAAVLLLLAASFQHSGHLPLDFHRTALVSSRWLLAAALGFLIGRQLYGIPSLDAASRRWLLTVLVALTAVLRFNPDILAAILVGLLAFKGRRPGLLRLALLTLLGALVLYYYRRHETLLVKAIWLALSGTVLGLGAGVLRGRERAGRRGPTEEAGLPLRLMAALAVLAFLVAGVNIQAFRAEQRLSGGTELLLRLAPRDPRDPFLGDYMDLRFSVANDIHAAQKAVDPQAKNGRAFLRADERGVAQFESLDQGGKAGAGRWSVPFRMDRGTAWLGMDKAYFQEGDAERFNRARYGRFKIQADGKLDWIGFADEERRPL